MRWLSCLGGAAAIARRLALLLALSLLALPALAAGQSGEASSPQATTQASATILPDCPPTCVELNRPPTATLTSPGDGQTFAVGQIITLTATATDSDGTVADVAFLVDGASVGTVTSAPYTLTWWTTTAGSHTVRARATDNGGMSADSSTVTITVNDTAPPGNPPPTSGTYSRTEVITYHDDTTHWVLGQTASVTCVASLPASASCDGNDMIQQTTFDPATALPTAIYAFGALQSSSTYNADGTLHTVTDGNGHTTTLANWTRGIPQAITFADGTTQTATVNAAGWITSVTDETGSKTCYGYDAMGRLASITYPSEAANTCNTTKWAATSRSFVPVASAEYGIAAGHWRLTETTGNAVKVTYFDALWRPLLVREYDSANVAGTERFTRTAYDPSGRVAFQSYPSKTSNPTTGVWTEYDALGRVTSTAQDSELGLLVSTTAYLSGFQTRVTNPRGAQTITAYQTYDQPGTDWPIQVNAPEGQATTIERDPYGKPLALTRSGANGSITRSYDYNPKQQLCRSVEPETGATLYGYDNAGNLSWSAAGLPLAQACSAGTESAVVARKVSRSYDARNRLSTLSFPDGNGNQSWNYTQDGLPATVITQNAGNPVTNTWSYNRRRLPTAETQTPDSTRSWSLTYGYNAQGLRTSETAPDNVTTTYTVNALGQTTQISVKVKNATTTVASNASYYPNGALQQFTYGNGITHTLTQNARQLPQHSQDGSVLDLTTTFDQNGNVAAIVDGTANARQSRSMAYDGLDRLTQVQSPMFGTASYGYDEQDNLRHVGISGGSQPRDHTYCYGADNRLEFVRSGPNCTGNASPAVIALGYDVQGNLQYKNGTAYTFDYGNRLRNTAGRNYRYDAAGRRVRADNAGTQLQYSVYAGDGRLVWQRDEAAGRRINNIYLAGSLVAEVSRPLATDTATYRYIHTDALGSPIAKTSSTGAVVETSEYEPYGQLLNRANDDRAGYTGHVMDAASGLIYMQQRYYDPQIGRFLSVDPVTAYSNPVGAFNRYWYANNNPYKFTDPDGRECIMKLLQRACDYLANFFSLPIEEHDPRFDRANAILVNDNRLIREGVTTIILTSVPVGRGVKGAPKVIKIANNAVNSKRTKEVIYHTCVALALCQGKGEGQRVEQEALKSESKELGQQVRRDMEERIQELRGRIRDIEETDEENLPEKRTE